VLSAKAGAGAGYDGDTVIKSDRHWAVSFLADW
jgi:hypothetical protein